MQRKQKSFRSRYGTEKNITERPKKPQGLEEASGSNIHLDSLSEILKKEPK